MVILVGMFVAVYEQYGLNANSDEEPAVHAEAVGGVETSKVIPFDAESFFLYILPPIIFEAGYVQCNNRVFMNNLGTIVTNAILGTAFNTFAIGYSCWGVALALGIEGFGALDGLVFGSLISAVDPVAVLAVFEQVRHSLPPRRVFSRSACGCLAIVRLPTNRSALFFRARCSEGARQRNAEHGCVWRVGVE